MILVDISFFSFVVLPGAWFKSRLHFKAPKFDHNFFPWDWWWLEANMDNTPHWWQRKMCMLATNVDCEGLEWQCQNFVIIIWFQCCAKCPWWCDWNWSKPHSKLGYKFKVWQFPYLWASYFSLCVSIKDIWLHFDIFE